MAIKYIMFDLDGTLLPMDQEVFVKEYLKGLVTKLVPYGFDPKAVSDGLWAGTGAMVKNDGSRMNYDVFWDVFCSFTGERALEYLDVVDDFYANEFQKIKDVCGFAPAANETIRKIKAMGYEVILATNPLFPKEATESRVRWAGMNPDDFKLITVYTNSRFCKPNLAYYQEILDKIGALPEECVMIGNDAKEDMIAESLGIKVFLLTDCLINSENIDISAYPKGSFAELAAFVEHLQ
ncbi:MAG: HAD family hydrolase [Oscillospiraceae bacterium]|nr:HAD family hydrolase [Oscillospiraceae bacterium]